MNRVLILFTCHNRLEKTKRCIESLSGDNGILSTFIVVDDGSTDGTKEYLMQRPNVQYVHGDGNLFYTGGMRLAIDQANSVLEQASYEYVLLVNDDVAFYPMVVSHMIDYLAGEQAVLVGATCDSMGMLTYSGIQKVSNWKPKFRHVMSGAEKIRCDTLNANCVLIPRDVFLALDNMDAHYCHSFGDYDYGFQITQRGYPLYASDFFVGLCEHDHPIEGTWQDPAMPVKERLRIKESPRGNPVGAWFYFLKKNYNLVTAMLYTLNDYRKIFFRV